MKKIALLISLMMLVLMLHACAGAEQPEAAGEGYSIVDYPHGSLIVVRDNKTGLYGGIDASGQLAAPCDYTTLEYIGKGSFGDRYIAEKDGKYGFVDETGKEAVPCEHDYIYPPSTLDRGSGYDLSDELAIIVDDDKYGFCSMVDGTVVIEPVFKYANSFSGSELAAASKDTDLTGYIDKTGTMVIPEQFSEAGDFENGEAMVKDENGKAGVIDAKGNTVVPCKYDDFFEYFEGGYAVVTEGAYEENCRFIAIDHSGNEIMSTENPLYTYGNLFAENVDSKYYDLYDEKGTKVSEEKYSEIIEDGQGIDVYDMDENAGLLDLDGNVLLPCKYTRIWEVYSDDAGRQLWEVRSADSEFCKLINEKGEELPVGEYAEIGRYSETGLAPVLHDGKVGFIDLTGKEVVPCEYYPYTQPDIAPEEGFILDTFNLSAVRKDGENHYAIMDANGKVVTDYKYTFVGETTPGSDSAAGGMYTFNFLVVKDDSDKYGVVDLEGKEIAPCGSFAAVGEEFDNGLILVQESEGGKWSLMDPSGRIVSDLVFDRTFGMDYDD